MNWVLIPAAAMLLALIFFLAAGKRRESGVDDMSGGEFEEHCARLLRNNGYEVIGITKASSDYGADIVVRRGELRIAVQCKRYSRPVGISAVQEAKAAEKHYSCQRSAVMTSSGFTAAARRLARENGVILFDRESIDKLEAGGGRAGEETAKGSLRLVRITESDYPEFVRVEVDGESYLVGISDNYAVDIPAGEHLLRIICGKKRLKRYVFVPESGCVSLGVGELEGRPVAVALAERE